MSVLETLTEGIKARSLANEGEALLGKWEKTGLLEGLSDVRSSNMARLLENQAAQLLKESSTMAAGDVEGFSAVAFPIVRRVFGNLLAQDLVSVQPMSLPSGLIFFLDFTYEKTQAASGAVAEESLYGGDVVASQLTGGVNLGSDAATDPEKSFYALNNGYSAATASSTTVTIPLAVGDSIPGSEQFATLTSVMLSRLNNDPDVIAALEAGAGVTSIREVKVANGAALGQVDFELPSLNRDNVIAIAATYSADANAKLVRRLTRFESNGDLSMIFIDTTGAVAVATTLATVTYNRADNFAAATATGGVTGAEPWRLEADSALNEIDIKVDSVAVTAMTRKLKAKWSPELGQDLNAYHNLDAEVELDKHSLRANCS